MIYYEINEDGQIIGQFDQEPQLGAGHTIIHTNPPPEQLQLPIWVGGHWIEYATRTEKIEKIDSQTYVGIKEWCKNQGKCEEYYINCGIQVILHKEDESKPENYNVWRNDYNTYISKVESLRKIASTKKQALP